MNGERLEGIPEETPRSDPPDPLRPDDRVRPLEPEDHERGTDWPMRPSPELLEPGIREGGVDPIGRALRTPGDILHLDRIPHPPRVHPGEPGDIRPDSTPSHFRRAEHPLPGKPRRDRGHFPLIEPDREPLSHIRTNHK